MADHDQNGLDRRTLLSGLGTAALASLLGGQVHAGNRGGSRGALGAPHHAPTAKRVIYLLMSGAPSQIDLWDPKPKMRELFDVELPPSVRMGQRITTMTSGQDRFPVAPSIYDFRPRGKSGIEVSDLLPHTGSIVDKLCVVRSMHTEAINHDPAMTFVQTGHEQPGRPSLGS